MIFNKYKSMKWLKQLNRKKKIILFVNKLIWFVWNIFLTSLQKSIWYINAYYTLFYVWSIFITSLQKNIWYINTYYILFYVLHNFYKII